MIPLCALFICALPSGAQEVYPEVGKNCPDFRLRNIRHYSKKEATLKDFKGKWLVLDFWNKSCSACIGSFPRTSEMQKQLGDSVQVMLVGIQDKEKQIEPMYARFREREKLVMPCAFDSSLANQWDIYSAPYIVIIDPNGKVRAITAGLNTENMVRLMRGDPYSLPAAYRMHEEVVDTLITYDAKKPLLVNGNGGVDSQFLFRSLLSSFDPRRQPAILVSSLYDDASPGNFQVLGASIQNLFMYAYLGTVNPDSGIAKAPVVEVRNDSLFSKESIKYCYSLLLPAPVSSSQSMQEMMRRDLQNYFPYIACLEERKFPCLQLIALSEKAKQELVSRHRTLAAKIIIPKVEFVLENYSIDLFTELLGNYNGNTILNGTGITGGIDIHFNGVLGDINDVKRELRRHGLDLVPAQQTMQTLVIRDRPSPN